MKKKKGYPRKVYSVEDILKDLVDEIGYEGIEKAINKKKKTIQNISNPFYKDRLLSHQDAIDLDIYCKKNGLGNPFLKAYETLIEKYTSINRNEKTSEQIYNNLVRVGESIGNVMEKTRNVMQKYIQCI